MRRVRDSEVDTDPSTVLKKYAMSVAAASVAETVTYPLDLTKTRLQLQGEVASGDSAFPYRGMIKTALGIAKEEGSLMLWRGMTPALIRHAIYTGLRMTLYDQLRKYFENEDKKRLPLSKGVIAGPLIGGIAQLFASPADLIKTQIQMEGKRRLQGKKPRVHGTIDAFRKIVAASGASGLWRGCWPNVSRAALVNLGDLTTYDYIKGKILENTSLEDNSVTHTMAAACAGLVGATFGTPADVVKARIMNQPLDERGKGLIYNGSWDCLYKTVVNEGFLGLYKGFIPCWLRMAPWSLTFWLSFEQIRKFCGATSW